MDVEETDNLNSASFSSSSTEDLNVLNDPSDHIRISPVLVISDDEASMSGFSVRSMDLDSSIMFNYSNSLEELPRSSSSRFTRRRLASIASPTFFSNENHDNPGETVTWEENNEDIASEPTERNINPDSPLDRPTAEPENDDIVYHGDNTDEYSTNELGTRLRQATTSQMFDTQNGESLDSEEHLFAPEEPSELDGNVSVSANNDNEEPSSISQRTSRDPYPYFNYLNPSSILPLTARYSALRAGNRLLPRSTIRNRFSVSSPFRLASETSSPGSGDSPLNLAPPRRLSSYWLNRSRILNLRNRTRSTYEHLIYRNRLHVPCEGNNSNSEDTNTTEANEDSPLRFRRRRRYFPDDEEIDRLNLNASPSSSYRSHLNLQSRSNSIEQRTSTFLRSMLDFHNFASLRSPSNVPSTTNCVRARSVSPTTAIPWFPSSVDHDSLDDTSVDVRDHSNERAARTSIARAVIDEFMNENQDAQIERPNTPLPPPISDDESPSTPTPTSTNYDNQLLGASAGITSTSNTSRQENNTASSAPPRTADLKEIPQTYEELNYELIQLLECPICFEYSTPPINQCLQGHIICSSCRQRVNSCPTCRNMFQESRNLVMEKVAALLRYPCKNAITGCLETLFLMQKEQHEQSCGFRHYLCFIPMCNWRGYKPELLVHVQEAHENHVIHGSSVNLLIPITGQTKKVWLMSAFNELFYVIFFATLGILKGCVRFIGDSSKSSNYTYTISVTSEEEMLRNMNYTRTTHAYEETTENIDILDSYDLFTISYPSLSTFRRGTRAPVRVTVEEVPNRPRTSN